MDKKTAEKLMQKALELAEKGSSRVLPNPRVGALVVKKGRIVSTGFHEYFGGKHAEKIALEKAGEKAKGGVLFVTLEPCTHFGKQPPCAPEVKKSGIKEVFIASLDPNQKKKGLKFLKENKIKVHTGILEKQALELNKEFFKLVKTGRPFVTVKIGASLDGKISFGNGKRKQISGKESTRKVFSLRKNSQAILVGKNTVLKDNPRLTSRDKKNTPIRIVLCSDARLPKRLNIFSKDAKTIIACTRRAKKHDIDKLLAKGIGVILCREKNGHVDLCSLLAELGSAGIASVLAEAGQETFTSFLKEKIFDELVFVVSPVIIGAGRSFVKEQKIFKKLKIKKTEMIGDDLWLYLHKTT